VTVLPANLVKTVLPVSLVTPPKSLVTVTIANVVVEAAEDVAVVMPLANLVKTVLPANLVTPPKSLVMVTIANVVDVAAEDTGVILLVNLAMTTKKMLKKQLRLLFSVETWAAIDFYKKLQVILLPNPQGVDETADEKKMLQKNHETKALFADEESADVNGSLTPPFQTESLILMVSQEKLSLEKLMKKWRVFL